MKKLIDIFLAFAKIGVMTFGGGYAMLPMLRREIVENKKWASEDELLDWFAIGQSTPGVISVNTATFVGYYQLGVAGAIAATIGVVFPSVVIITVLAALIQGFYDYPLVGHALAGISAAVAVLIFNTIVNLWKKGVRDIWGGVLFGAAFAAALFFDVPSVVIIISAVVLALVCEFCSRKGRRSQ